MMWFWFVDLSHWQRNTTDTYLQPQQFVGAELPDTQKDSQCGPSQGILSVIELFSFFCDFLQSFLSRGDWGDGESEWDYGRNRMMALECIREGIE